MNTTNTANIVTLTPPQQVRSLASSAILVCYEMRTTTLQTMDEKVSAEITDAKKADRDSGNFIHKLIGNNPEHRRVMAYRATLCNFFKRMAFDWGGGWYLLPAFRVPQFRQEWAAHEIAFASLVDTFLDKYPDIVADMAFKRGDLFDRNDYPTVDQLRGSFSLRLYQQNVPEGDFRSAVANDLALDLQAHYQKQVNEVTTQILNTQTAQLADYLKRISKACTVETVTDKDGNPKTKRHHLYESTIQQAIELCDTFAAFNPTGSTVLAEARGELADVLAGINVPALKESDTLRAETKAQVDSILSKFGF